MDVFEFFKWKKLGCLNQGIQIVVITLAYMATVFAYWYQVKATGKMDGYAPGVSILFVPIYEEMIFRGVMLKFFEKHYGKWIAISATSLLFGLWHLKNIFWLDQPALLNQILYTTLVFGPINAWITLKTKSLWPSVLVHYLNNFPFRFLPF